MNRLLDQHAAWRRWYFNAGDEHVGSARGVTVDEIRVAEHLGRTLSGPIMDLVELVAGVHLVDRGEARPHAPKPGSSWSRRLHLTIGVRDPRLWSDAKIHDPLLGLLRSLTDDEWLVDFVPRVAPNRPAECVQFLFESAPGGDVVALFSGGLDSLAGLAADVGRGISPLAVSIESNRRLAKSQRDVISSLNMGLDTSIVRVPVELHLKSAPATENSQRARGFGFLALATVVATLAGLESVHVYENGIGALNLPYTAAQTGAHGNRAMRPETLARAAQLFSVILDRHLSIVNTSQPLTKTEMCAALPAALHPVIAQTESCDTAFAYRGSGPRSCGRCTSCLLRRQALASAGLSRLDPLSAYRIDAFALPAVGSDAPYELRAMLSQAARLQRAFGRDTTTAWPRLVREFPDLVQAVQAMSSSSRTQAQLDVTDMLHRYVNEWAVVASPLVTSFLDLRPAAA
jgi:7-cyano-7-deazaguanine synthase in queuosine biosynthesis